MLWNDKPYYSLNHYYKAKYKEKVYKIALNANLTCPNRDGKISTKGCIFCSEGGSGDFTFKDSESIKEQISKSKELISKKYKGSKYIAYFQAYTNTYGDIDYLRKIFHEAISQDDIIGISIATRPDCINNDVLELLMELNSITDVWVELGLQSIHEDTAKIINRGYTLDVFDYALDKLNRIDVKTVVHLIIGLPGESKNDIINSVKYISSKKIHGIKLQLLHILKNTPLEEMYQNKEVNPLSLDEYIDILISSIENIPRNIVIHRITGDAPKKILIEPQWSGNKKYVLNEILKSFKIRNTYQGKRWNK